MICFLVSVALGVVTRIYREYFSRGGYQEIITEIKFSAVGTPGLHQRVITTENSGHN